jgi:hypothetical protein
MSIIQISKIQQRSGNLVDLPQLDEAEFGWASDTKRLFIGKTTPNENVEVLTSYSQINFSQINGSVGNLNISNVTVADGQALIYDGTNWVNRGGNVGGLITLGDVSNVKITGGAIGYVLETDGLGNLSWTPKSTIIAYIQNVTKANPAVVTTTQDNFLTDGVEVTITDASGMTQLNGNTYYANVLSSNSFSLYSDPSLTTGINTSATITLSSVTITGTAGQFGCSASSAPLSVGQEVTISGTFGGTGSISGYSNPTTYYIVATNGSTTLTLSTTKGGTGVTTTAGTPTGLTYTVSLFSPYSFTTAASTSASTNRVTIGNSALFSVNQEVLFLGDLSTSGIELNTSYYVKSAPSSTTITLSEELLANGVAGNTKSLTTATLTGANVYAAGGRIIASVGGAGGTSLAAYGSTDMIQYNVGGLLRGNGSFTFNEGSSLLSLTGNANVSNLNATGIVTSSRLISNIATGVAAPLAVSSTDRVANLNVSYSNVTDFSVVTNQTTGTFYPVFASSSATGNRALGANANISFNAATGNLSVTLLNVASNANVGNLGTGGLVVATGNVTGGNLVTGGALSVTGNATTGNLSTTTAVITTGNITTINSGLMQNSTSNVAIASGANVTLGVAGTTRITATATGANVTGTLGVSGNATVGNISATNANITAMTATGNVTAVNFIGIFANGTSDINIPAANGNINFDVAGNANIVVVTGTGANIAGTLNATGNANVGNLGTAGLVIATGNVSGGNLTTAGVVAATGNVSGGNLTTAGVVAATGNVSGGNITTAGVVAATGNVSGGNLTTAGVVAATGNVSGGNLTTGGALSVTANATTGNLSTTTAVITTGNITTINSGLLQNGNSNVTITANGNVTIAAVGGARITATATGANVTGTLGVSGNANVGNLGTAQVLATANVTAPQLISNVSTGTAPLTVTSTTRVDNLNVAYANVADFISVAAGTGNNFLIFANAATGNITEVTSTGLIANLSNNSITATTFVGALSGAATSATSATTAGTVTTAAQPNITSVGTLTSLGVSGALTTTQITAGANTTAGTITGNWTLTDGSRLQATYADLAEYYEADEKYLPGTVLMFGGEKEVTLAEDGTSRVAGVVSTNPAYVMNSTCPGLLTAVALQGRVPCKVRGKISKGDMLISGGNGFARPNQFPAMGTVIGKALEDFDGYEGVIEVAVGRL